MPQIVHADFKSIGRQDIAQFFRNHVVALGYEVKRGPETQLHFQFHQRAAPLQSLASFDVVRQDQRKALAVRPTLPSLGPPSG